MIRYFFALTIVVATSAAAQVPSSCNSADLRAGFEQFGRTGTMPADLGRWLGDPKAQYVEPYKAFDDVWYVGVCWVSAWAIRTSDGVVLIDTLHEPHVDTLLGNLRKAGIALDEIKYVLMTHGHFDHVGGAYRLRPLTRARFVMSQRGWDEAIEGAKRSEGTPRPWKMIGKDLVLKDGESLKVGDNVFTLYETPGHTFGTASYSFRVHDGAKTYRAFTVGGLGLNAIQSSKQVEGYISSVTRIEAMVKDRADPIAVHLTTHPFSNGLIEAKDRLAGRKPGDPHPLVDPNGFLAQLEELKTGAEERLALERKAGR